MSKTIEVLSETVANQIAAGEVCERPLYIVKELLENSIDAGATKIKVSLKGSGIKEIKVVDNGEGISKDNLSRAFLPHATSKIRKIDDLNSILTLGFRGEALPSIASVSKVKVISKVTDSEIAYSITINGGVMEDIIESPGNDGTSFTAGDIFYNTPARKKFLSSPLAELNSIVDIMGKLILSRPDISFELVNNSKRIYFSDGKNNLKSAIFAVYGRELAENLIEVNVVDIPSVKGYISHPSYNKANRSFMNYFVNGRYIKCDEFNQKVMEAYRSLLPDRRFPVAILNINADPSEFDVNVHPNKLTIKFHNESDICNQVYKAVRNTLDFLNPVVNDIRVKSNTAVNNNTKTIIKQESISFFNNNSGHKISESVPSIQFNEPKFLSLDIDNIDDKISDEVNQEMPNNDVLDNLNIIEDNSYDEGFYQSLDYIGIYAGTYILCGNDDGLFLIDQHAAYERLNYEKIKNAVGKKLKETMPLLISVNLELSSIQYISLVNNIVDITNLGFLLEDFGDNSFIVREVPLWAIDCNVSQLLIDMIDNCYIKKKVRQSDLLEEELVMAACKSSVKANQYITDQEVQHLFYQLDKCYNNLTCPHGRPIAIEISMKEIRKRFLRI